MSIKGYKSQQALQQKLGGYTEDQSIDRARYTTVQEMPGKRHSLDVIPHGITKISAIPLNVLAGSNIRVIKATAHGALINDVIKLSNGTEFSALSIPDSDTIITSVELDASPVGDTITVWRYVTPSYGADGSITAALAPPVGGFAIETGGNLEAIKLNTDNIPSLGQAPGNASVPVVLTAAQEALLTPPAAITGFALDTSVNTLLKPADTLSKVSVVDTITNPVAVTGTFYQATQPVSIASMPSTPVTGTFWQATQPVSGSLAVSSSALPTGASTSAAQSTGNAFLDSINTNQGTLADAVATTDAGSFSLISLIKKVASNITAMSAKLPALLGPQTGTNSLSVVQASSSTFATIDAVKTPSFQEILNLTNTMQTFTAPTNARWCKVYADDTNSVNIRVKLGGNATVSSGVQFQAGRSEDFEVSGDITVIAESAAPNQKICVIFGV